MNREPFDNSSPGHHPVKAAPLFKPFDDIGRSDHETVGRKLRKLLVRLGRFYDIEKASLTFYDYRRNCLHVTHMFSKGALKSGLTLSIPDHHSLLYQVLMQGFPIVDNYPELVTRNIIEKKILLGPATRSVAVIPLLSDGLLGGILSLASEDDSAFSLYLEGRGEELVTEFIADLSQVLIATADII